jgi:hypothetical protein
LSDSIRVFLGQKGRHFITEVLRGAKKIAPKGGRSDDRFDLKSNKKQEIEMKKVLFVSLAFLLAACGVVQPVQQEQPTPIIATVLVTVIAPTEIVPPTDIPLPTQAPTEIPTLEPTAVPLPTDVPATEAASTSGQGTVNVDNLLGKGVFSNITFSSDLLTLNCTPRELQITMNASLTDITRAEMYYRIVDQPSGLYPSEWILLGNLGTDGKGKFFTTFTAENINPNYRALPKAWIDFQFIGVNKGGGVVDRTQRIERLVTYSKECP